MSTLIESDLVTCTLIDLHTPSPNCNENLLSKFMNKLCSGPLCGFSQNFNRTLKSFQAGSFNMVICGEFNYLITGTCDRVVIFDLITCEKLKEFAYVRGVYGIDLERHISGQLNLVISSRDNYVEKYDFSAMLVDNQVDENGLCSMGELIWKSERKFEHVWAVRCFKSEVYVIDFESTMFVLDSNTGLINDNIEIDLGKGLVDLVFTPENEMIVCGVDQLHLLKFNQDRSCWEKVKSFEDNQTFHQSFGVWYERKSRLIYLMLQELF